MDQIIPASAFKSHVGKRAQVLPAPPVETVRTGIIRFSGNTKFADGPWVGVELDSQYPGKNNGSVQGIEYFSVSEPGQGIFVRPELVQLMAESSMVVIELRSEVEGLQGKVSEAEKQAADLCSKIEELEVELEIANEEKMMLDDELKVAKKRLEYSGGGSNNSSSSTSAAASISAVEKIQQLEHALSKQETTNKKLQERILDLTEQLEAESAFHHHQNEGSSSSNTNNTTTTTNNNNTNSNNSILETLLDSKLDLEQQLQTQTKVNETLKKELKEFESLCQMQSEELSDQQSQLLSTEKMFEERVTALSAALHESEVTSKKLRAKVQTLEKEFSMLSKSDEEQRELIAASQAAISAVRKSSVRNELQNQVTSNFHESVVEKWIASLNEVLGMMRKREEQQQQQRNDSSKNDNNNDLQLFSSLVFASNQIAELLSKSLLSVSRLCFDKLLQSSSASTAGNGGSSSTGDLTRITFVKSIMQSLNSAMKLSFAISKRISLAVRQKQPSLVMSSVLHDDGLMTLKSIFMLTTRLSQTLINFNSSSSDSSNNDDDQAVVGKLNEALTDLTKLIIEDLESTNHGNSNDEEEPPLIMTEFSSFIAPDATLFIVKSVLEETKRILTSPTCILRQAIAQNESSKSISDDIIQLCQEQLFSPIFERNNNSHKMNFRKDISSLLRAGDQCENVVQQLSDQIEKLESSLADFSLSYTPADDEDESGGVSSSSFDIVKMTKSFVETSASSKNCQSWFTSSSSSLLSSLRSVSSSLTKLFSTTTEDNDDVKNGTSENKNTLAQEISKMMIHYDSGDDSNKEKENAATPAKQTAETNNSKTTQNDEQLRILQEELSMLRSQNTKLKSSHEKSILVEKELEEERRNRTLLKEKLDAQDKKSKEAVKTLERKLETAKSELRTATAALLGNASSSSPTTTEAAKTSRHTDPNEKAKNSEDNDENNNNNNNDLIIKQQLDEFMKRFDAAGADARKGSSSESNKILLKAMALLTVRPKTQRVVSSTSIMMKGVAIADQLVKQDQRWKQYTLAVLQWKKQSEKKMKKELIFDEDTQNIHKKQMTSISTILNEATSTSKIVQSYLESGHLTTTTKPIANEEGENSNPKNRQQQQQQQHRLSTSTAYTLTSGSLLAAQQRFQKGNLNGASAAARAALTLSDNIITNESHQSGGNITNNQNKIKNEQQQQQSSSLLMPGHIRSSLLIAGSSTGGGQIAKITTRAAVSQFTEDDDDTASAAAGVTNNSSSIIANYLHATSTDSTLQARQQHYSQQQHLFNRVLSFAGSNNNKNRIRQREEEGSPSNKGKDSNNNTNKEGLTLRVAPALSKEAFATAKARGSKLAQKLKKENPVIISMPDYSFQFSSSSGSSSTTNNNNNNRPTNNSNTTNNDSHQDIAVKTEGTSNNNNNNNNNRQQSSDVVVAVGAPPRVLKQQTLDFFKVKTEPNSTTAGQAQPQQPLNNRFAAVKAPPPQQQPVQQQQPAPPTLFQRPPQLGAKQPFRQTALFNAKTAVNNNNNININNPNSASSSSAVANSTNQFGVNNNNNNMMNTTNSNSMNSNTTAAPSNFSSHVNYGRNATTITNSNRPSVTASSGVNNNNSHNNRFNTNPDIPIATSFMTGAQKLEEDARNGNQAAMAAMAERKRTSTLGNMLPSAPRKLGLSRGGFQAPRSMNNAYQNSNDNNNSNNNNMMMMNNNNNNNNNFQQNQNNNNSGGGGDISMNRVVGSMVGDPNKPAKKKKEPQNQKKDSDDDGLDEDSFPADLLDENGEIPAELKKLDTRLVIKIHNEIMERETKVTFADVIGLDHAQEAVNEAIIFPLLQPQLYKGILDRPRGLLCFGPPGTGKTMIAKSIAHEAGCTFFSISSSVLNSKWIGEGEKLVRCLFAVARAKQPAVVFIDEIDSLLTARSSGENDAMRRMKTEFLVQLDGAGSDEDAVVLLIGATNRPQELDEAARRRLEKRLYIPLPSPEAREMMVAKHINTVKHSLTPEDIKYIASQLKLCSGDDVKKFCKNAAGRPLRDFAKTAEGREKMKVQGAVSLESDLRELCMEDFTKTLAQSSSSTIALSELKQYQDWNEKFGTFKGVESEEVLQATKEGGKGEEQKEGEI